MQKHAYLIIANRNPGQLQTLLTLLDDSRNDIYLLVDRKSVGYPRDFQLNYATLFSVSPLVIDWGSYSQIEAEMRLFQAAAPGKYAYYHLLSGLDLPLANQDEIHAFFAAHPGKEFITYSSQESGAQLLARVQKYHFTHNFRQPNKAMRLFRKIEKAEQRVFPVRKKFARILAFGSNWVSLENNLVQVLLRENDRIRTMFDRGFLVDELLVPTMLNIYPEFKTESTMTGWFTTGLKNSKATSAILIGGTEVLTFGGRRIMRLCWLPAGRATFFPGNLMLK